MSINYWYDHSIRDKRGFHLKVFGCAAE
jgi:hypothetical protein